MMLRFTECFIAAGIGTFSDRFVDGFIDHPMELAAE
jgi:hypothetical protein